MGWLGIIFGVLRLVFGFSRTVTSRRDDFLMSQAQKSNEKRALNPPIPRELSNESGFVFGKTKFWGFTVAKSETMEGHILVVGGSGTGKSSCIAIPTLFSWQNRALVIDVKGELYERTKKRRQKIKVYNPSDHETFGYNPFHVLDGARVQSQEAEAISQALLPISKELKDDFWIKSARDLMSGAILHYYNIGFSFTDTMTAVLTMKIRELVQEIRASDTKECHSFVNSFVDMEEKTLIGIYRELSNHIRVFDSDSDVKNSLSKDSEKCITLDDLEFNDVYIIIEQYQLESWKGLLTLIISQYLRHFAKRPDKTGEPILFLLDEFPSLGKMEGIVPALRTLRSKNITISLFIQSLADLEEIYGKPTQRVIRDNCRYLAILNALDTETQEDFSKLVGTYEKMKETNTRTYNWVGLSGGTSHSRTTEEKPRIKAADFSTLDEIVLISPFGFFRVQKSPWFAPYRATIDRMRDSTVMIIIDAILDSKVIDFIFNLPYFLLLMPFVIVEVLFYIIILILSKLKKRNLYTGKVKERHEFLITPFVAFRESKWSDLFIMIFSFACWIAISFIVRSYLGI